MLTMSSKGRPGDGHSQRTVAPSCGDSLRPELFRCTNSNMFIRYLSVIYSQDLGR